jgi:uncharacterized protein YfaP (DUF2135 family)
MENKIRQMSYAESGLSNGIISVTLTWDGYTDLDLHVYEPSGTHVYYANKTGYSGYIDRDDMDGIGPEHYVVSCDTIQTGPYKFGVNYYRGWTPQNAAMFLKAGDEETVIRYKTLSEAQGYSGNTNPVIMFELDVTGNSTDGYNFHVR